MAWKDAHRTPGLPRPRGFAAVPASLLAALVCGCEPETRIVYNRPFLGSLPGAESSTAISRFPKGYKDPTYIPDEQLVIKDAMGKPAELRARTARHLMMHIYSTLMNSQETLFVEQVLSEKTRSEYYQRGLQPSEAFKLMQEHAGDILTLFDRMPMGESTPGLFLQPVGGGVQRLVVQGLAAKDLYWTGFDMVMEKGNWKLVWFVPGDA
ncbi:MAG TPA: hypothetical protein VK176_11230 [Phycisphaerales bacterium]|nr:hypothetical protein [Phycisphaerales bacterium]